MAKIPKQRPAGGRGGHGHSGSIGKSWDRGGRPRAGGGGSKGNGCAVTAVAMLGGALALIGGTGYGLFEAAKAVLS